VGHVVGSITSYHALAFKISDCHVSRDGVIGQSYYMDTQNLYIDQGSNFLGLKRLRMLVYSLTQRSPRRDAEIKPR